jgi:hypothetical protein
MSDKLQNQIRIAEQHYNSIPADLRNIYEAEYAAASAAYLRESHSSASGGQSAEVSAGAEQSRKRR